MADKRLELGLPSAVESDHVAWLVRVLVTLCVAYFLARRAQWARWATVGISILAVIRIAISIREQYSYMSTLPLFVGWGLLTAFYYAAVASLLVFSKRIAADFALHHVPSVN